jgi:hypothetical protein
MDAAAADHSSGAEDGPGAPTDGSDAQGMPESDAASDAKQTEAGEGRGGGDSGDGGGCAMLPSGSLAVAFANAVLARWPNPESLSGATPAWEYNAETCSTASRRSTGARRTRATSAASSNTSTTVRHDGAERKPFCRPIRSSRAAQGMREGPSDPGCR